MSVDLWWNGCDVWLLGCWSFLGCRLWCLLLLLAVMAVCSIAFSNLLATSVVVVVVALVLVALGSLLPSVVVAIAGNVASLL